MDGAGGMSLGCDANRRNIRAGDGVIRMKKKAFLPWRKYPEPFHIGAGLILGPKNPPGAPEPGMTEPWRQRPRGASSSDSAERVDGVARIPKPRVSPEQLVGTFSSQNDLDTSPAYSFGWPIGGGATWYRCT